MPVTDSVDSGAYDVAAQRSSPIPRDWRLIARASSRPCSKTTCSSDSSSHASVSGRTATCSNSARGLGAAQVDHDDTTTAAPDGLHLLAHPWRRDQRCRARPPGWRRSRAGTRCGPGPGSGPSWGGRRAAGWPRSGCSRPGSRRCRRGACRSPARSPAPRGCGSRRTRSGCRSTTRCPRRRRRRRPRPAGVRRPRAPRPTRPARRCRPACVASGCSTRSGSFWTSVMAMPLGQAKPRLRRVVVVGAELERGRPSSTVATRPHDASQMRQ